MAISLTNKQTQALDVLEDKIHTELIFGGGAGGAKSFLGCYWVLKNCVKYPGTRWVIGRHTYQTLRETTLKSLYAVLKLYNLKRDVHFKYNKNDKTITLWNESEILLKDLATQPSDPEFDELGSLELTGAFVDECNQIDYKAWTVLKSRIRYLLDENGLIPKILGTCNPAKNWVYTYFYKANKEATILKYRAFIQSLATDNPHISRHYIDNLKTLPEVSRQRLLLGNWEFDDDPTVLIPRDAIDDLYRDSGRVMTGQKYITADIARFGRDSTVICLWNGYRCYRVIKLTKKSVDQVVEIIEELRLSHKVPVKNIIVDEDGIGGGVVDYLRCHGFTNNGSPIKTGGKDENFFNLKSQCYFKLADIINDRRMYVNIEPDLQEKLSEELGWVKQRNMDKDEKKRVLGKDEIKNGLGRSPDLADSIMMRCFFDIRRKVVWGAA